MQTNTGLVSRAQVNRRRNPIKNLIENRTVYESFEAELSIYDTFSPAKDVQLNADEILYCGMISGKKTLHGKNEYQSDFLPHESFVMAPGESITIDFPEAKMNQPTSCLTLGISRERLRRLCDQLNQHAPPPKEVGEWRLDDSHVFHTFHTEATQHLLVRMVDSFLYQDNDRDLVLNLGVVGQIIPWNFPILMAAWKLGPALAAGNCVVMKPAEQTPASILVLMELIADILPPGVVNIVNGLGEEAGQALATSNRIAKIAFTGSTQVGTHVLKCAADLLIPSTVELGGKSPNLYFNDIMKHEDEYLDKCVEGMVLAFFNQGEVCTCPSRALIQEDIYNDLIGLVLKRAESIRRGNPLDTETQVGAQASQEQFERILSYINIGKEEGAKVLMGGDVAKVGNELSKGYYIQPTMMLGNNKMKIFQEEIFGPVISVTTFKDEAEALAIANDTEYGLGAGLWTRDMNRAYRMGRSIQAGRIWTNCYHAYPAHAAFGGYKKSGIGRETHKKALEHYQQTKNLLVSYSTSALGFF